MAIFNSYVSLPEGIIRYIYTYIRGSELQDYVGVIQFCHFVLPNFLTNLR